VNQIQHKDINPTSRKIRKALRTHLCFGHENPCFQSFWSHHSGFEGLWRFWPGTCCWDWPMLLWLYWSRRATGGFGDGNATAFIERATPLCKFLQALTSRWIWEKTEEYYQKVRLHVAVSRANSLTKDTESRMVLGAQITHPAPSWKTNDMYCIASTRWSYIYEDPTMSWGKTFHNDERHWYPIASWFFLSPSL